jgi:hypothetical protein
MRYIVHVLIRGLLGVSFFGNQPPNACESPLDHLKVRSGLVLDAEPFLNSLRRVHQEQFAKSVSDAVRVPLRCLKDMTCANPGDACSLLDHNAGEARRRKIVSASLTVFNKRYALY